MGDESHKLGLLSKDGFLLGVEFLEDGGVVKHDGGGMFGSSLQCTFQAVGVFHEWWSAVDKADEMFGGTCGGLLDAWLLLSKKMLALSNPPEGASRSALNFSLLL